ncbi:MULTISPECIES: PH domain-containing protein [unclassified Lentimicrobium]|uniref:PH domain-containing protein n=1 Tax=unclassified Lentimicrobium TaxID=2677434 RepID=UPI001553297F|nr:MULTISPECIES: PH domain-containing protein [unclassified Lentimicrobium]NPD46675.1 PH domain-containing protein [Lentimicrobium sp. S6]NPD85500.1 PH domain-containing protein [Lentimicrobium sp. L6]
MTKPDLTKPTRQEPRGFLAVFAFELQAKLRAYWPMLILIFAQKHRLPESITIPMVIGIIILLILVHSILFYLNFYFFIDENQFILKKGYLRKKVLSIPLDRIQSVNTNQNLLQRLLNVHSLEVETAGSVGKELKIYSLSGAYTEHLTEFLQSHKEKANEKDSESISNDNEEKEILKLSPLDLLRIGISQNHLKTGLIILVFTSQIVDQIQDLFKEETDAYSDSFQSIIANSSILFFAGLTIIALLASVLATLLYTVIKYYDFRLVKHQESYKITTGLIDKRKVLLPFNKIQQLNWETGPIKKIFGIFRISFKQAVSKQTKQKQVADAPGCLEHHISSIRGELFKDDLPDHSEKIYSHPRYFNLLWLQRGVIPAIAPSVFYFHEPLLLIAGVAWLIISGLYCRMMVRKSYFQFNKTQLIVGKGAINTEWQQAESFKTQSVDFRQSFFQKRRGLATLRVNNASGQMNIPYISEDMAHQLMNYLLYHVETSREKWM